MNSALATLAVVFDFDDTLVPDSTTKLLHQHGIDTKKFWKKDMKRLVQSGYDPALAYLRLLLDNIGPGKPLGRLKSRDLRNFGTKLDRDFYPGLPDLFKDLRRIARKTKIDVEFFVI